MKLISLLGFVISDKQKVHFGKPDSPLLTFLNPIFEKKRNLHKDYSLQKVWNREDGRKHDGFEVQFLQARLPPKATVSFYLTVLQFSANTRGPEELFTPRAQGDLCLTLQNCKPQNVEAALGRETHNPFTAGLTSSFNLFSHLFFQFKSALKHLS